MIRYSLLRLLVFFACLAALWLLGLRSHDQLPWLVVAAGSLSMVISWFALKPFREQAARRLAERVKGRQPGEGWGHHPGRPTDEEVEDAEGVGERGDGPEQYR